MEKLEQRIALAKARGWTKIHTYSDNAGPDLMCGNPPPDFKETFRQEHKYGGQIPAITLDEMFIVEEEILAQGSPVFKKYAKILSDVVNQNNVSYHGIASVHATAWQKCEAILRLLGDWKE